MPAANTLQPTFHQKQVNEGYNDNLNLMVVKIHPNSSAVLLLTTFICPLICVATPFYVIKILQKSTLNRYEHLCEREREWDIENETERECDRERKIGVWVCNVLFTVGSLQVSLSRSFSFSYTGKTAPRGWGELPTSIMLSCSWNYIYLLSLIHFLSPSLFSWLLAFDFSSSPSLSFNATFPLSWRSHLSLFVFMLAACFVV